MTLGTRIIAELRRRRLAGYFSFRQYRALHRVDSVADLRGFIEQNGLPMEGCGDDPAVFVDALQASDLRAARKGLRLVILDSLLLSGLGSLVWLWSGLLARLGRAVSRRE